MSIAENQREAMNNAVYDYRGSGARLIGYRCHECQQIKPSMWGEICNECREKERRHQELIEAKDAHAADARIAELEDLLREAEGLLCDPRGGQTANELARRIVASLMER